MKKQVLITISYIAEMDDSILTGKGQQEKEKKLIEPLSKRFPRKMKLSDDVRAEWERTSIITLDHKHNNCSKCSDCGCWVTDKNKPDYISGLFIGEYVNGKIYCSQCAIFTNEIK